MLQSWLDMNFLCEENYLENYSWDSNFKQGCSEGIKIKVSFDCSPFHLKRNINSRDGRNTLRFHLKISFTADPSRCLNSLQRSSVRRMGIHLLRAVTSHLHNLENPKGSVSAWEKLQWSLKSNLLMCSSCKLWVSRNEEFRSKWMSKCGNHLRDYNEKRIRVTIRDLLSNTIESNSNKSHRPHRTSMRERDSFTHSLNDYHL